MANQNDKTFAGIWHCAYWFPSNTHAGEDVSEYYVEVHQIDRQLVLQSLPNKINAYLLARLTVDGNIATGTWEENTSPTGEFKGATYSGAMQLLVSDDQRHMEGKWVGIGQEAGKHQIYTGRWEMSRTGEAAAKSDKK